MTDNKLKSGDKVEVTNANSRYWRCKGTVTATSNAKVTLMLTSSNKILTLSKHSVTKIKEDKTEPLTTKKALDLHVFVFAFLSDTKPDSSQQILYDMDNAGSDDIIVKISTTFDGAVEQLHDEIEDHLSSNDNYVFCYMPDKSFIEITIGQFEYAKVE